VVSVPWRLSDPYSRTGAGATVKVRRSCLVALAHHVGLRSLNHAGLRVVMRPGLRNVMRAALRSPMLLSRLRICVADASIDCISVS
jgi:hypothetical protein